jgi:His-Xaa-Ser system protein HxsD
LRCWAHSEADRLRDTAPVFFIHLQELSVSDTDTQASSDLEELVYDSDGRRVAFTLDEELYPRDAIFGAAYLFIDRCFVFLARPADRMVQVRLKGKSPEMDLEALAGEFANALLDQVLRFRVAESTGKLREYAFARAFFTTPAQSSIDQLLAELDDEELEEDDLEVAVPWEQ